MKQKKNIKVNIILEPLYFKKGYLHILEKYWRYMELKLFVIPKIKKIHYENSINIFSRDKTIISFLKSQGINNAFLIKPVDNKSVEISKKVKKIVNRIIQENSINTLFKLEDIDITTVLEYDLLIRLNIIYTKIFEYEIFYNESIDDIYVETLSSYDGKILKYLSKRNNKQIHFLNPKLYRKIRNFIFKRISNNDLRYLKDINIYIDKRTSDNNGKVILVDAVYINYLRNIVPVLNELSKKYDYQFYYIAKKKDLKHFKIRVTDLKKFKSKIETNQEIKAILNNLFSDENCLKVFENDFDAFILFKEELYKNYENSLVYLLMKLRLSKNFISEIYPHIILVGDDRSTITRIGILPYKDIKIPIVEIQHGIFGSTEIDQNVMIKPISDKICVWGNSSKQYLIKLGLSEKKIDITGSPQFDNLRNLRDIEKKEKVLLFTTQPDFKNINIEVIEEIGKNEELKDFVLYVKPHPDEDPVSYNYLENKFPHKVFIRSKNENLCNLLMISDLVLLMTSSAGLEAAIHNKPLICINYLKEPSIYVDDGIALEVKNIDELIPMIKKAFNNNVLFQLSEKRHKFVKNHVKVDDKSTESIINIINDLINN